MVYCIPLHCCGALLLANVWNIGYNISYPIINIVNNNPDDHNAPPSRAALCEHKEIFLVKKNINTIAQNYLSLNRWFFILLAQEYPYLLDKIIPICWV